MSMDRKNKKDQQRETREGGVNTPEGKSRPSLPLGTSPDTELASPVAIRSALSSSIQSPPPSGGRHPSSPMREPFGPPSAGISSGFGRSPGQGVFASSPSRPSPLSASFSNRPPGLPGSLALKSSATVAMHSPLRPPTSASSGMFSSSYSHVHLPPNERGNTGPLSASFADNTHASTARNIWAQSATPEEPLSPRRPILKHPRKSTEVFMDEEDEEDHGEDFLPASLNDLLTPAERARRLSRRDSNDSHSYGVSPARAGFLSAQWGPNGTERLAQSAGANLGPANFLQSLWSTDGADRRRVNGDIPGQQPHSGLGGRSSLLTQTKSPNSPQRFSSSISPAKESNLNGNLYPLRPTPHPSSPSAKAINEHAPGKSLPGGVATALSRLHLYNPDEQSPTPGGISKEVTPPQGTVPLPNKGEDHEDDDGLFAMDG
jgi:cleavage and polyadenylation specificity factor subunit 4